MVSDEIRWAMWTILHSFRKKIVVAVIQPHQLHCKNIRISTDILWRVFHILMEPVPYTFLSINRRNDEAGAHIAMGPSVCLSVCLCPIFCFLMLMRSVHVQRTFRRFCQGADTIVNFIVIRPIWWPFKNRGSILRKFRNFYRYVDFSFPYTGVLYNAHREVGVSSQTIDPL